MITPEHRAFLNGSAITDAVIDACGIDSDERGIVFPWRSADGTEVPQLRPDVPDVDANGRPVKYVWPQGAPLIMNQLRDSGEGPVLIVEGTKQQYAALSWAPGEYAVYGISGCWGWIDQDRVSWLPDVMFLMGRDVFLLFDADMETNYQVHKAASEFTKQLKRSGVASVRYVQTTARGTNGLDDVLSQIPEDRRTTFLSLWINQASARLPKAPKKPPASPFIAENGGLLVRRATEAVLDRSPAALTAEREVALYIEGAYRMDPSAFISRVVDLLGDLYKREWRANIAETATGILYSSGLMLPERQVEPLVNVKNGMLHLPSMTLKPHDPAYMSSVQIPLNWDPEAKAPTYEAWAREVIPDQLDDLEETASTMLDPSRTPSKAVFLFGPSRSGKSTYLRLLQAIAGQENRSAVTLHQLCSDRFAAANVYGKILNASADLSAAEISDLSVFKMMTGEDSITGNRKYGNQFTFTNRALFAFSANELPTVGESSRAYLERIKPFQFARSFAGRENPAIEAQIMNELEGVLVRLVIAWQRMNARGGYSPTLPRVREAFEVGSNRVRQWIADEMRIVEAGGRSIVATTEGSTLRQLHQIFSRWAEVNKSSTMGLKTFTGHLTSIEGVREVRIMPTKTRGYNVVPRPEGGEEVAEVATPDPTVETPSEGVEFSEEDITSPWSGNSGPESATSATTGTPFVFDLETADADQLHRYGPGFIRLAGYTDSDGQVHTVPGDGFTVLTSTALSQGAILAGHNIAAFDLVAMARHQGLRLDLLKDRVVDTDLRERLLDPPPSGKDGVAKYPSGYYGLDASCKRRGLPSKTDDLSALAKRHGGYDQIPTDDPEYVAYLRGDVEASRALLEAQGPLDDYARREMNVALVMAQMTVNGFRVDVPELARTLAEQEARKKENLAELASITGLPLTRVIPRKRLEDKVETLKSPLASKEGKEALKAYLVRCGIGLDKLKRTAKSREISFSGEDMRDLKARVQKFGGHPELERVLDLIVSVSGERTVYQTLEGARVADRVHYSFRPVQASGRWSGGVLTVLGKRAGRHVERRVLLPEEGHRLIAVDLDQVDARGVAALSAELTGDWSYADIFRRGLDLHGEVAQEIFGDRGRREDVKPISHGWNYGRSVGAISLATGLPLEDVAHFDAEMRRKYPGLVQWQAEVRAQASAGQLIDNGWGRKMRPDPDFAYTQAPALAGQGCTRDILAEGLLRLPLEFWPYLRAVIHDEVVLSVPEADAEEIGREVVRCMSFDFKGVPITAGCSKPGKTWADVYAK